MGIVVIVAFRPKPGKEGALLKIVKEHVPILRGEGLVTDRRPVYARAKDGTVIEVFEWKSLKAIEDAHRNARVGEMWKVFEATCTYEMLVNLAECKGLFAGFEALDL